MPQSTLLPLLADGKFRSGQDLADSLGVSRTAVWKQINKLNRETGLDVESVKGKGYRIAGGIDLLDEEQVVAALNERARPLLGQLQILENIDSTNSEVMRQAQLGAPSGLVCSAEQQSAGRGRRGRQWVSPYAGNLYVSLLWSFSQGTAAIEGLSLAVGVAVSQALASCGVPPIALKWPNDVLCGGAKLGGILIEMTGDADGACQVVIGIGVNVARPAAAATEIDQLWTDVGSLCDGNPPGRNKLLAALLNELLPLVAEYEHDGFAAWQQRWQALDAFADALVVIDTGAQRTGGVARGVDSRGALQLETATGMQSVFGGEISLRAAS